MAPECQALAFDLRGLVVETAEELGVTLEEALRWGEPAYLPGRTGTTVRIAPDAARVGCKLLVHCRTPLVEGWRARFEGRLQFEGNRAILVPGGAPYDRDALQDCISDAMTYKRRQHG
jgi:hypothetical protein